jgi:hypothetical protein
VPSKVVVFEGIAEHPTDWIEKLLPWRKAVRQLSQPGDQIWSVAGRQRFRFRPRRCQNGAARRADMRCAVGPGANAQARLGDATYFWNG